MKKIKIQTTIIVLNLLLGILLIILIMYPALKLKSNAKSIKALENKNLYAVVNTTDPAILYSDFTLEELKSFFVDIFYDESSQYVMYKYLADVDQAGNHMQRRLANQNFFKLHHFSVQEGRAFSEGDFKLSSTSQEIPILVGNNLSERYPLGSVQEISNGDGNQVFDAQVVGILEKNTHYPHLYTGFENLDDSYIIPISMGFIENYFGISDFYMATCNILLDDFKNRDYLKFADLSNDLNLFTLQYKPVDELVYQLNDNIKITMKNRLKTVSITIAVLLVLTLIEIKVWKKLTDRYEMKHPIRTDNNLNELQKNFKNPRC